MIHKRKKFTQEWKMLKGFRIIRMNPCTQQIEQFCKPYKCVEYWKLISPVFKSTEEMERSFSLMLQDDYTITEDCKLTYFE